jgi:hypothetical protein
MDIAGAFQLGLLGYPAVAGFDIGDPAGQAALRVEVVLSADAVQAGITVGGLRMDGRPNDPRLGPN